MLGTLSAFTSYAVGIFEPIQQLARLFADLISAQANIERVTGLLEQKPIFRIRPLLWKNTATPFTPKKKTGSPSAGILSFKTYPFATPTAKNMCWSILA